MVYGKYDPTFLPELTEEMLEALWPETYVNQEGIRKYILEVRKILGDRPNEPQFAP
jgi:DNA-binding winged helix-turn-helix (wHTH) protein